MASHKERNLYRSLATLESHLSQKTFDRHDFLEMIAHYCIKLLLTGFSKLFRVEVFPKKPFTDKDLKLIDSKGVTSKMHSKPRMLILSGAIIFQTLYVV